MRISQPGETPSNTSSTLHAPHDANWKKNHGRTCDPEAVKRFTNGVAQAEKAVPSAKKKHHPRTSPSNVSQKGGEEKRSVPSSSLGKRILTCSAATIALGAMVLSLTGFATAKTQPLDKAGSSIVTGQSTSPLAASSAMPYEGHVSFTTWSQSYDDGQKMLSAMGDGIEATAMAGRAYITEGTFQQVSQIDTDIADNATLEDIKTSYDKLNVLSDTVNNEIATGIAEEQAAAERERRRGLVVESLDPSSWSDEKLEFVVSWGARVDAYLSGRTLNGYGQNFAAAAYDHEVDPRIGAAISVIESGGGDICFRPHNAWGWGSSSWDSWSEAIEEWTASFNRGYGYDMDYADCRAYCPPNAGYYDKLRGQMESI